MSVRSTLWEYFALTTHLRFYGYLILCAFVLFVLPLFYLKESYPLYIAILLSIGIFLIVALPIYFLFSRLHKKKKAIERELDEFYKKERK